MIDVFNKRVTVMGLGLSQGGVGVTRWLLRHGAQVTVTDLKTEQQLAESVATVRAMGKPVTFVLGKHREQDFTHTDLVIKNPGVPNDSRFLALAKKNNVPIETEMSIFVSNFPGRIAGVTGTKGKTTTTTLLYDMLAATGRQIILGGNLRKSPLMEMDHASAETLAVLELSSFQLESFKEHRFSPHVAVWTNLFPDHLDRYKSMEEYQSAKERIMRYQKLTDFFITSADQPELVALAKKAPGQAVLFSTKKELPQGLFISGSTLIARHGKHEHELAEINRLQLHGQHNVANVLAAMAAALSLGVAPKTIREVAEQFKGVANRLEHVATIGEVAYINDTASTIPSSTIAALYAYKKPIVLIAGGSEKNLPLEQLAQAILDKAKKVVLFETAVGVKLAELMTAQDPARAKELIDRPLAATMQQAVQDATNLADKGDIVLLSPGTASFGMFQNEFDRGEQFVAAVTALQSRH